MLSSASIAACWYCLFTHHKQQYTRHSQVTTELWLTVTWKQIVFKRPRKLTAQIPLNTPNTTLCTQNCRKRVSQPYVAFFMIFKNHLLFGSVVFFFFWMRPRINGYSYFTLHSTVYFSRGLNCGLVNIHATDAYGQHYIALAEWEEPEPERQHVYTVSEALKTRHLDFKWFLRMLSSVRSYHDR